MRIIFFFFCLSMLLITNPIQATFFQQPPKGWQCVCDPQQLPAKVLVLYIGHGKTRFAPTIHVASDPLLQPIESYINAAKKYHQRNTGTACTDLGQIMTGSGPAFLLQIESPSLYGEIVLLQGYVLYDHTAFVITGISLKEEFKTFSALFYDTLRSFYISPECQK